MMRHSYSSVVDLPRRPQSRVQGACLVVSAPYRVMLETLLSYGEDAKKTQLSSALYYKDAAGQMDTLALAAGDGVVPNEGLVKRSRHTHRSRVVDMMGRLHADIFFPGSLHVERSQCQDKVGA